MEATTINPNLKVLARAREMQALLRRVLPEISAANRRRVRYALEKADRDIPKTNRIGKQMQFDRDTVREAVERAGGDKKKAAKQLGCSLRTIYAALQDAENN